MSRVLVTGAGGFVGGWIVESFLLSGIEVRAGIRSWNSALRLVRHPTDIVPCDVLSPEQLLAAMDGCDGVVHCAVGNEAVVVQGTQNVMECARRLGVRRVVHLSSVAVYGKVPGVIRETHRLRSRGNPYAQLKIQAEEVCLEQLRRGTPIVVLRPSVVYGPFSEAWTTSFAKRLLSGCWGTLGERGAGFCNLVYVTDVVQAVYRALHCDGVVGQTYNINGDERIRWNEYFQRFNAALDLPPLQPLNTFPFVLKAHLLSPIRNLARFMLLKFGRTVSKLHAQSSTAANYMNATESSLKLMPTPEQLKLYRVEAEYVIDKARTELGYVPQVDLQQGLTQCVAWLNQQGVLYDQLGHVQGRRARAGAATNDT